MSSGTLLHKLLPFTIAVCLCACGGPQPAQDVVKKDTISAPQPATKDTTITPDIADTTDYATVYVTVADTGTDYYELDRLMYQLSKGLRIAIDTMNRHYDKKKHEIIVAEDDDDELYRGVYFPRRYPSANLSLEYYSAYIDATADDNIALVTGIYEKEHDAAQALALLQAKVPHAFMVKASIYMGCMH